MAKLQLSFACGLYDRMQPLYTGEVRAEGIDLNFIAIEQPRAIFDRMAGGEEFDVAEFSSSEFVQRFANKQCPFVAIPVFPSRAFRHGFIAIHRKAGIKTPKDLEGKRVGVPLLTMTAAIYINGLLQHEYGVDLRKIRWVQGAMNTGGAHGSPTVLPLLNPIPILPVCFPTMWSWRKSSTSAPRSIRSCTWSRSASRSTRNIPSLRPVSTMLFANPRRSRWRKCSISARCVT